MNTQTHRKMNKLKFLAMLLVFFSMYSCNDDDDDISDKELVESLGTLEVQLVLSEGLSGIPLSDVSVTITNTADDTKKASATSDDGAVTFEELPLGNYNIEAIQSAEEYTLSGSEFGVLVAGEKVTQKITVNAVDPTAGLVIKEVFTSGAEYSFGGMKDMFVEIYNNSSETLYADGMYIANLFSPTNPITEELSTEEYVYADYLVQVPGTGEDYPVPSGRSIVIAKNAINFKESVDWQGNTNPDMSLDNTDATLEIYSIDWLEARGRIGNNTFDLDNPDVPNMTNIYIFQGDYVSFLFKMGGAGVVLVSAEASFSAGTEIVGYKPDSDTYSLMRIPVKNIVDGVEILKNADAVAHKRLPTSIDAGFSIDGTYFEFKSSRRLKDEAASVRFGRTILQDTNNSTVDFELIDAPDKFGYNQDPS